MYDGNFNGRAGKKHINIEWKLNWMLRSSGLVIDNKTQCDTLSA